VKPPPAAAAAAAAAHAGANRPPPLAIQEYDAFMEAHGQGLTLVHFSAQREHLFVPCVEVLCWFQ
jgi:hypothetical protein